MLCNHDFKSFWRNLHMFIADFFVAMNADQIKTSSMTCEKRVEKYNQFLRIEEELEGLATLAKSPQ